ncbi:MAG TPA: glycosyltransferase family 4 protein [Candidatus Thermoplasmatota archaeon]|nr:glycosyltransferase family 4 protein [Candidatus Thermoplasmatota archaeon]
MDEPAPPKPLAVTAITQGRDAPSTRFRVSALVEPLARNGVTVRELHPTVSSYPPRSHIVRPAWGLAALASRLPAVAASRKADVVLLQREMVSTFATLERFTGRPRVLDVDDAVFLFRNGKAAAAIAGRCDLVLCGNAYLQDWFRQHCGWTEILPTAVDPRRYCPPAIHPGPAAPVIGWTGSSSGFPFLSSIEPSLARVLSLRPAARLRVVADQAPDLPLIPRERLDFVRWSPAAEIPAIQGMSVGLMPLPDTPWTRGKCGLKMLLYLSCGVPAVASPVGMNRDVIAAGPGALGATSEDEWVDAILGLLDAPEQARAAGLEGRRRVAQKYGVDRVAADAARFLRQVAGGRS